MRRESNALRQPHRLVVLAVSARGRQSREGCGMSNDPAAFPGAAMPMTRERLVASWTEKAAWLTRCGVPGAGIYRQCLAEIEQLWTDEDQRWLTAAAAAEASGYTEDHLRRMARDRSIVAEKRR